MVTGVPWLSLLLAAASDVQRASFRASPPREIEDLVLSGKISDEAMLATLALLDLAWTHPYYQDEEKEEKGVPESSLMKSLRTLLYKDGLNEATPLIGDVLLSWFAAVLLGDDLLVRSEPWSMQCVDEGYAMYSDGFPKQFLEKDWQGTRTVPTPEQKEDRLFLYKHEANYRRDSLSSTCVDGPPDGYPYLLVEIWTPLPEGSFWEYLSVEIWSKTPTPIGSSSGRPAPRRGLRRRSR